MMEDIAFRYPKKILRAVILAALVVAIAWGLITRDPERGAKLYIKEAQLIATPMINYAQNRMQRVMEKAFQIPAENKEKSLENQ